MELQTRERGIVRYLKPNLERVSLPNPELGLIQPCERCDRVPRRALEPVEGDFWIHVRINAQRDLVVRRCTREVLRDGEEIELAVAPVGGKIVRELVSGLAVLPTGLSKQLSSVAEEPNDCRGLGVVGHRDLDEHPLVGNEHGTVRGRDDLHFRGLLVAKDRPTRQHSQ